MRIKTRRRDLRARCRHLRDSIRDLVQIARHSSADCVHTCPSKLFFLGISCTVKLVRLTYYTTERESNEEMSKMSPTEITGAADLKERLRRKLREKKEEEMLRSSDSASSLSLSFLSHSSEYPYGLCSAVFLFLVFNFFSFRISSFLKFIYFFI